MMNLLSARRARACGLSSLPLVLLASIASACSSAPPPDDAVMSSESVVGGGGLTPLFTGANSEFDDNVIADPDGTTTHVYAIRSADQTITHQWGDPTKSMPSETLGRIGSSLSVARSPSGADWYAESVGGDENVYVNHWGDWSWHGWYSVGTPPVSTFIQGPTRAAVAVPVGNVHVFAVGRDGNLWHRITTGSPTSQLEQAYHWESMPVVPSGSSIAAGPVAVPRGGQRHDSRDIDVFVRTNTGEVWHLDYHVQFGFASEGGYGEWQKVPALPMRVGPNPRIAVASPTANEVDAFVIEPSSHPNHGGFTPSQITQYVFDGSSWRKGAVVLPCTTPTTPISAASPADGVIDLYLNGYTDGRMYRLEMRGAPDAAAGAQFCRTSCGELDMACCDGAVCHGNGVTCNAQNECAWAPAPPKPNPPPAPNPPPPNPPPKPNPPACGGLNQPCCAGNVCSASMTYCASTNHCLLCGSVGMPCCANRQCGTEGGNALVCTDVSGAPTCDRGSVWGFTP